MTWILKLIGDESTEQDIYIDRDMLVGRHQDADIRLLSAEISRRHAAFLLKEQTLWLQDLNSSNGTFVNAVRIVEETQIQTGDELAFAQLKYQVLQTQAEALVINQIVAETPVEEHHAVDEPVLEIQTAEQPQQSTANITPVAPAEAVATSSAAAKMNEQGMPSMAERAADVSIDPAGMPERVAVPKPAPIPAHVDLNAAVEQQPVAIPEPESVVQQAAEQKKNTSVGLMTIIVLIILAVIAWLMFK